MTWIHFLFVWVCGGLGFFCLCRNPLLLGLLCLDLTMINLHRLLLIKVGWNTVACLGVPVVFWEQDFQTPQASSNLNICFHKLQLYGFFTSAIGDSWVNEQLRVLWRFLLGSKKIRSCDTITEPLHQLLSASVLHHLGGFGGRPRFLCFWSSFFLSWSCSSPQYYFAMKPCSFTLLCCSRFHSLLKPLAMYFCFPHYFMNAGSQAVFHLFLKMSYFDLQSSRFVLLHRQTVVQIGKSRWHPENWVHWHATELYGVTILHLIQPFV